MEWTEELIARLRDLWSQGLSTAEIGRQLSITKNAVVGKAHRLELPSRPSPIRSRSGEERVARPRNVTARKKPKKNELPLEGGKNKKTPGAKVVQTSSAVSDSAGSETKRVEKSPQDVSDGAAASRKKTPTFKMAPPRRVREAMDRATRRGPSCQWPEGDPGTPEFHFCGATPLQGKPYCAQHAAIAYVKIRDRRH